MTPRKNDRGEHEFARQLVGELETARESGSFKQHKLIALLGEVENATLVWVPPPGAYSYELKYDGYRILALKLGEEVRLISRRGHD
jgi:ATP-dependent DNA ligase